MSFRCPRRDVVAGIGLVSGICLEGEDVAHFVGITSDDGVGACAIRAVAAHRDERDAIPRPLRAELVSGEFIGKQPQQVSEPAQHNPRAERNGLALGSDVIM